MPTCPTVEELRGLTPPGSTAPDMRTGNLPSVAKDLDACQAAASRSLWTLARR